MPELPGASNVIGGRSITPTIGWQQQPIVRGSERLQLCGSKSDHQYIVRWLTLCAVHDASPPPEVERAAKLLRRVAVGKEIVDVEAVADPIVFTGADHAEFVRTQRAPGTRPHARVPVEDGSLSVAGCRAERANREGRTAVWSVHARLGVGAVGTSADARYTGKVFYLILDGEGRHPVLHFGMTGMLQVKGQLATYYRETPRKASTDWPPRFMKFILHLRSPGGAASDAPDAEETLHLAFLDTRRLGRIRLCRSPLTEPPISALGFDPLLSMPGLDDFKQAVPGQGAPARPVLQRGGGKLGRWCVASRFLASSPPPPHLMGARR
ncbi:hypothetical protein BC628DRAFT_1374025 [Trametes gibbosa]|nr:hypothetical protein BC628DRAFT_1374025 [Trametes gibbosa]